MLQLHRLLTWLIVIALAAGPLSARAADAPVLLVVGDSISAGFGLAGGEGWVTLLGAKVKSEGYDYRVINASISASRLGARSASSANPVRANRPSPSSSWR